MATSDDLDDGTDLDNDTDADDLVDTCVDVVGVMKCSTLAHVTSIVTDRRQEKEGEVLG